MFVSFYVFPSKLTLLCIAIHTVTETDKLFANESEFQFVVHSRAE